MEGIHGVSKSLLKTKLACSPFASPSPYSMFHPGYGISGYHLMASIPSFTFPHPSYDEIISSAYHVPENVSQRALVEIQDVVTDLNKKMRQMEAQLKKKE